MRDRLDPWEIKEFYPLAESILLGVKAKLSIVKQYNLDNKGNNKITDYALEYYLETNIFLVKVFL